MKLNAYILAGRLPELVRSDLHSDRLSRTLRGVRLYRPGTAPTPDYLYLLGSDKQLPEEAENGMAFACCDRPGQHSERADCLWMPKGLSEAELLSRFTEIFDFFHEWENRMLRLLAEDAPLKELGSAGLDVLDNPLAVYTPGLRNIFCCERPKPVNMRVFRSEDAEQYLTDEEITTMKIDPEFIASVKKRQPSIFSAGIFGYRILYVNICLANVYIARLTVLEIERPFRDADFSLAQVLADFLTKVLQKQDYRLNGHPRGLDELVENLLARRETDPGQLQRLLHQMGWKQTDRYFCCAVYASRYDKAVYTETTVCTRLESAVPFSCAFRTQGDILLIANLSASDETREKILSKFIYMLRENLLKAGVSLEFEDFTMLPYYLEQARAAIDVGSRTDETIWCYRYESYALQRLLLNARGNAPIETLCPPGLLRLMRCDRENNRDYVEKLRVYLNCDRNIAETIRKLYVQRATFLYQLKRIQEISGLDLEDSGTRLLLQICLSLLEQEKKQKSPPAGDGQEGDIRNML